MMPASKAAARRPSGPAPRCDVRQSLPQRGPARRIRAAISTDHATEGLLVGKLRVPPERVVFVKGIIEASDGLASLFAERGGDLCIAAPHDRAAELRELLFDLAADAGGSAELDPEAGG